MLRNRPARCVIIALLAMPLSACVSIGRGGPQGQRATELATGDEAITIASFAFPESRLLAEIYAQALEAKGFHVKRALGVGPRELVEPALEKGLLEFVPEYLGTATEFVSRGTARASSETEAGRRALAEAFADRGISVLASAPAQDANALAVTAQTAAKYDLKTISDLKPIAARLVLGGPPECPSRPLCLPGLKATYGLTFERFDPLDVGGPITVAELDSGLIDVAVLFTTDWQIQAKGFVVLDDDLGMQPAENVTPVVRQEILTRYGDPFSEVVDAVSSKLTTQGLAEMNGMLSRNVGPPEAVAAEWLRSKGLVQD